MTGISRTRNILLPLGMCYHKQTPDAAKIAKDFKPGSGIRKVDYPSRRVNGFDHPELPVVLDSDPGYLALARWGLLPFFAKDPKEFYKTANTLNCMIETAHEKASYKRSVDNRCLIPVEAFYEWKHVGKEKIPHRIWVPGREVFNLAGLWSEWRSPEGEKVLTYTVLTTQANTLMAEIHNSKKRMPVVLLPEEEELWLRREPLEPYHARTEVELKAEAI